jgi:hypothetical protein
MTASTGKYRKRGTGSIRFGYLMNTKNGVSKFEHIEVAERALGRSLPSGAIVHHIDKNRMNNAPTNLVICQSAAYHRLIHRRMDAMEVCGNPEWRKCWVCKTYDAPERLYISPNGMNIHHKNCTKTISTRSNK